MDSETNKKCAVTPFEAIDGFLDALRNEFRSDPELTYRVLKALNVTVEFDSAEAVKFVNPIEIIGESNDVVAEARLNGFTLAQLKKMAQGANLATATDLKGLKKDGVIAVLIKRGREKIKERRL